MAQHLLSETDHPIGDVFTVSRLNREARDLLEGGLPLLWVEGEISNLARPGSGHIYFSLKDEQAQVRCAMFRMRNMHLGFTPANGMHVLVRVRVSLYEARGEFQLIVEHMEEAGDGALRRAFEVLKRRLQSEGLFESARKRELPSLPRRIGVVTSPVGAAICDILSVLRRRFPAIPVVLYPVAVQGNGAAAEIARAIHLAGQRGECDVLIVGRGGGSLEDLWAFNEEPVARAIFHSPLPVVSAVGHEVDFTIADFVADCRAPTPSAAAELLSPDAQELGRRLAGLNGRIGRAMNAELRHYRLSLTGLQRHLRHPGRRLQEISQRLDELQQRLGKARGHHFRHLGAHLGALEGKLARHTPIHRLARLKDQCRNAHGRLTRAVGQRLGESAQALASTVRALEAVSPLATLTRGYAIVTLPDSGQVISDSHQIKPGAQVETRLARGRLLCHIEEVRHEEE